MPRPYLSRHASLGKSIIPAQAVMTQGRQLRAASIHATNIGTQRTELGFDVLVTTVEVVDAIDQGFTLCRQTGEKSLSCDGD